MKQEHMSKCLALLKTACGQMHLPPDHCLEEAVKDVWQLARATERERCARICESRCYAMAVDHPDGQEQEWNWKGDEAQYCADAIRKGETLSADAISA